jgi:hypothetical protein
MKIINLGKIQLKRLRNDITLGSLYISDYRNRYNIDPDLTCTFFDGFLEYIEQCMYDDIPGFTDNQFFDYLPQYDNIEYLWEYLTTYAAANYIYS